MSYSCNFKGECEPDSNGRFESEEKCEQACYSRRQKDVNYLIQSFAPQIQYLAPSDAAEVVYRITGVRNFNRTDARVILNFLDEEQYIELLTGWPVFREWFVSEPARVLALRLYYLQRFAYYQDIGVDGGLKRDTVTALAGFFLELEPQPPLFRDLLTRIDAWYSRPVGQNSFLIRNEETNRIYTVSVEGMTYGDLVGFIRSIVGFYEFYVVSSGMELKVRSGA